MKNKMVIENRYSLSIPVLGTSGGPTMGTTWVTCILDSNSNGVGDTGSCSGFHVACSTNLQTYCNTGFATASTGQRIDDEDVQAFYNTAIGVANDRSFTPPVMPSSVNDNLIIDDNHHDVLKNWLDGTHGFSGTTILGTIPARNVGDVIDASAWGSIREKLKNMAKLCNDVSHCDCNTVCSCNTVCTCNCQSNY